MVARASSKRTSKKQCAKLKPEACLSNEARIKQAFRGELQWSFKELPKTATGKVQKYVLRGRPAIVKQ
jgi:acyl-coenzyme A synthetase/AMP-(fatty) acid ligase